jgi:site-specific recombinase XerD
MSGSRHARASRRAHDLHAERHGYRANELVELKRSAINLQRHTLPSYDRRAVSTPRIPCTATRRARGQLFKDARGPYVFVSERGAPMTRAGFQRLVESASVAAGSIFRFTHTCSGTPAATG